MIEVDSAPGIQAQALRTSLVCCMRNEGMFVVEWLAHHLVLGFDRVTVFTNNCTDGSDQLLSHLAQRGYVRHIDHSPAPGKSPQDEAMRIAIADQEISRSEWILHIDADEFVDVEIGDGRIGDLIDAIGTRVDVIALFWKLFGDSGVAEWNGGSVVRQFTRSQGVPLRRTVHHKSLFRPEKFARWANHMPKEPLVQDFVVVNTKGDKLSNVSILHPIKSRYKAKFHQLTFSNACLNHYAVKSPDLFLMKNDRGDGHGTEHTKYYLNSRLHRRYNRNEVEDTRPLRHWSRVTELMEEMRSDPMVRSFEAQALEAFRLRRAQLLTPEQVARWTAVSETEES